MNIISIDPSLTSTAICIKNTKTNEMKLFNYTSTDKNYKWIKIFKPNVVFRYLDYTKYDNYSDNEINKNIEYDKICECIINDCLEFIDTGEKTYICMEGYSYGSGVGYLVDLVTFSTLLRRRLITSIPNIMKIKVIAPKSLKLNSCEVIYGFQMIEEGKRVKKIVKKINKNKKGISGGDFDKFDMLESIYDGDVDNPMFETLKLYKEQLLSMSSIKKPVEDLVDAILLNLVAEKKLIIDDDIQDKIEY